MKGKGILTLVLLSLVLSGGQHASAEESQATRYGSLAWQSDVTVDCLMSSLPSEFDYEIVTEASGAGQAGDVLGSVLCNYILSTNNAHPDGSGLPSGMAITVEFSCPAETQERWTTKGSSRDTEIERTSNYVLLREGGEYQGYAGEFTLQERVFALLDTHTVATIVVLTDPSSADPDAPVLSAKSALPAAVELANTYASSANDPACGAPPGASISVPGQGTIGGGGGSGSGSGGGGSRPWESIESAAAVAVAVGAGLVAALAGGLVGGTGTGSAGTVPAGAPGTNVLPVEPVVATPTPVPASMPVAYATPSPVPAGVGPPPAPAPAPAALVPPQVGTVAVPGPVPADLQGGAIAAAGPAQAAEDSSLLQTVEAAGVALATGIPIAQAAASSRSSDSGGAEGQGDEGGPGDVDKPCVQAQATLFGLPAINSRKDCPGERAGMDVWCAGIDFTSTDEYGRPAHLDFEAGVSGVVTYIGGEFNMVEVRRTDGNRIQYLHASEVYVATGQRVEPTTKLGKTGGAGRDGTYQYEVHLHVQAIDEHGSMIDPDCALAAGDNRKLRVGSSTSPYLERIRRELEGPDRYAASPGVMK